nr:MAG TPA: hypothetical protein [Caudoviricetes sp.]DAY03446.1 MAG TPA: hypothetical protein [Caudoviricetes sp.]
MGLNRQKKAHALGAGVFKNNSIGLNFNIEYGAFDAKR